MSTNKVELVAQFKDRMSGPAKSAGGNIQQLGKTAVRAGAAIGVMAAALFAASKKLAEYGAAIYDTAQITGVGVERIQALGYQFEQTGGSLDSFQSSLRGLTTFMRMADSATSEQGTLLAKLGLEYETLKSMEADELFLTLADALSQSTTAFEQMTDAATIFGGRYSQQVVGLINETQGDLRGAIVDFENLGIAMSEGQINKLKAFDDAMTKFGHTLKGMTADALVPLLEPLLEVADVLVDLASRTLPAMIPLFAASADALKIVADALSRIDKLAPVFIGLTAAILTTSAATGALSLAWLGLRVKALDLQKAVGGLKGALGAAGLGLAVAFTTDKVIKLIDAINKTDEALDSARAAGERADEAFRYDAIRMVELQRAIEKGSVPALLILQTELENMEHFTPTALINDISSALDTMGIEAIEASIAQLTLAQSMLSFAASGTAFGDVIDLQIAKLIEMRNEIANTTTITGAGVEPSVTPPGTMTDELTEKEKATRAEIKEAILAGIAEAAAAEQAIAENRLEQEQTSADARHDANVRIKNERLEQDREIEGARLVQQQRFEAMGVNGANNIADILINKGEDWEEMMLRALAKIAIQAAAISIGGPIGGIFGFIGGLFQQGTPSIPHAQNGWKTPTGLYGDRFPVMIEGGEEVVSREQRIMNHNYNTSSSNINITIPYQPTFSTASPGEMVVFGEAVTEALERAGVSLG